MKNQKLIFFVTSIYCLAIALSANSQVYNTGNLYIASSGVVYINDSLYHDVSAVYQNDGTLTIKGNFINNSASLSGTGSTQFNSPGGINQFVEGTQTSVFGDVTVYSNTDLIMKQNVIATGNLLTGLLSTTNINGYTLTVNNGFSGNGKLRGSASSNMVGGGSGNIYFDHNYYYLKDFTINSGANLTLGDSLNIVAGTAFGTLTANGALTSAGYLTMKSNSLGTARVDVSTDSVRGYATVERYIPPRRAWRALCIPFKNTPQTIREAWQEGVNNTDLNYANNKNPKPGFGMHISGNNNTSLGFDYNTTYNASILTWNQPTNDWTYTAPPTISTNIGNYEGYFAFVRGSRAVNLALATSAPSDSTILRARGVMNFGAITKNYTANIGDQVLIANPYPSSISLIKIINQSTYFTGKKFWVWDPKITGTYGTGSYVTYNNGVMVPNSGSYPQPTTVIQEQQCFWLEAKTANPILKFSEDYKIATEFNVYGRMEGSMHEDPKVYINLLLSAPDSAVLMDGVAEVYNNRFSPLVDWDDAVKLNNFYENIALKRDNRELAIETRPYPELTDTIFIDLWGLKQRTYIIQTLPEAIPGSVKEAWLIDNYYNTYSPLSLIDESLYSFTVSGDPKTYANRFLIVFTIQRKNSDPLPAPIAKLSKEKVSLYPNPSVNGKCMLMLENKPRGSYEVSLFNAGGQKVSTASVNHSGGTTSYPLALKTEWPSGIYKVVIVNKDNGTTENLSLMIQQ